MSIKAGKVLVALDTPCPCGSGSNYRECCSHKPYEWLVDEYERPYISVPVYSPKAARFLKGEIDKLLKRGAQQLDLEQYIFPGWSTERVDAKVVDAMKRAGIDPAIVDAYKKTGLIVTDQNERTFTRNELQKWGGAVTEYRQLAEQGHAPEIRTANWAVVRASSE